MSPGYLRLDGLNASHSRLAGKYSLWLYREQGWDLSNKPHGVPVLFAPGNAGSYRQVRSLAAAAARQFYTSPGKANESLVAAGHQELDFFSADFNEDFSAFHAGTLQEQAEYLSDCIKYIRSLYREQEDAAPTAVIVLAHSMGGIAARYMFLQEGFDPGSVKTLVTLSTPHAIPPATFDRGVDRIYHDINGYWRLSYEALTNPLNETLCISIAGGIADTMISSDYADMSSLVPPSHGFSVMTTSTPTLFSPVDHQAMMWCDQLRHQIISALLESTDSRRPDRSRGLDERLAVFRHHLLTGAELLPSSGELHGSTSFAQGDIRHVDSNIKLSEYTVDDGHFYRLDFADTESRRVQVTIAGYGVSLQYHACEGSDDSRCQLLASPRLVHVPSHNTDPRSLPHSNNLPVTFQDVEMPNASTYCLLKISKPAGSIVQAHTYTSVLPVRISLLGMYLLGWTYDSTIMPAAQSGTVWQFGRLDTSLMVYSLSVTTDETCSDLRPVVRVSSGGTFESQFFAGTVKSAGIHLHSGAPYLQPASHLSRGMLLQAWYDASCPVKIALSVNRKASLGTVVTRYRSIIASWPIFILLGTMRHMLAPSRCAKDKCDVVSFNESLKKFIMLESGWWVAAITTIGIVQVILLHIGLLSSTLSSMLLGTHHLLFLPLGPAFLAVVTVAVLLSNMLLKSLVSLSSSVVAVGSAHLIFRIDGFSRSRLRFLVFALLALFVLLFAPHQFAILSLFLMQFLTTIRTPSQSSLSGTSTRETNFTILLLLLWLLPSNGAILLVWLRNLQAGWWRPFPSDHNVFAILGVVLLVEHLGSGRDLRPPPNKWTIYITRYLLMFAMLLILLWGGRYVFIVGEIVNIFALWLAALQYDSVRRYLWP